VCGCRRNWLWEFHHLPPFMEEVGRWVGKTLAYLLYTTRTQSGREKL